MKEKYAVLLDDNKTKTASKGSDSSTCPTCQSKVSTMGNVIACSRCGTKPFEKTRKD